MNELLLSRQILVVDDEPDTLAVLGDMLSLHGANVRRATSGTEALALISEEPPDLLVLDLAMPDLDGWQVLNHVREDAHLADLPVVAISAFYSDELAREALAAGFTLVLPKPIRSRDLIDSLLSVMS